MYDVRAERGTAAGSGQAGPAGTSAPAAGTVPATIGVDPGQKWTAAVLRVGDFAEHGWTVGPVNRNGLPDRAALDELVEYAAEKHGAVRVGIEVPRVPIGWTPGAYSKFNRMRAVDWILPKQVAAAVLGAYPESRLVLPDHLGRRPASEYPRELRGARPPGWGPNEARKGERDHERAAYDIAGLRSSLARRSSASASCGTHFGWTKLVASRVVSPAPASRRRNSSFVSRPTTVCSFCSPSRGPTSQIVTRSGRSPLDASRWGNPSSRTLATPTG